MSDDQQPTPPRPVDGWGGEYDAEATAFVQLPGSGELPDPLAAPGTGQGWEPPAIPPMTPAASMDPTATGHWTLPFAASDSAAAGEPGQPEPAQEPEPRSGPAPSAAAAMGQGAAAALAGSHEARAQPVAGSSWAESSPQTGQWTIPAAEEGIPDDSGEYRVEPAPEPGPDPGHPSEPEPAAPVLESEHPHTSYVLHVNGADRPVTDAWIGESLLYVLRERLGLAGAKDGCSQGECGACSVQVDGRLVAACLVPAATSAGSEIRTVEGLCADGSPSDVQRALAARAGVQCGFCVPGMVMTVHDLLEGNHAPTELQTRRALCGNLCRCSGYRGVLQAVRDVSEERAARAARAAETEAAERAANTAADTGTHEGMYAGTAGSGPAEAGIPHQPHIPHQAGPSDQGGEQ